MSSHALTPRPRPAGRVLAPLFKTLALLLLLNFCPRAALAQDATPEAPDEVVRVSTDLVTIPFFVTDPRGRRVAGLARGDFEVTDNGARVEPAYFAAGAEQVSLLFLLDASGSTRDIITEQRETALALFSHFGAGSRVAVMQFRERAELKLPFTRDLRAARPAFGIDSLAESRTAIFDAALAAARAFSDAPAQAAERRIVVLISDGLDNASAVRFESAVEEARDAGVTFYCIHLPLYAPRDGRLVARRASKGFRELAERTGGQFFVVGDARTALDPRAEHDLRPVFQAIAEDLRGQYVLGYHASAAPQQPGPHRVEVRLADPSKRKLRLRQLRDVYVSRR
ncbi:MAG TPA: VWA domain-containing protein [Pyrinomonadaceae bacterium]|jgi:Ca-activated chloride channel family protein|nr:VWA domain-containing protein [Pyrinomonadaceae bacterium]